MLEKEILGCMLQDNSLILETVIQPSYFEKTEYQLMFQSMLKLAHEDKAVDQVTLIADNYQYLSELGGTAFIRELESNGKLSNFETYEKQLIDKYKARQAKVLAKNFTESNQQAIDLIEKLQELDEIGIAEEQSVKEVLEYMFTMPEIEQTEIGIPSGLKDLDDIIGGFQPSNSYILGARPSMGKSATMLKFALNSLKHDTVPVIFSLEMSKESLLKRLIATIGQINLFLTNNPYSLSNNQKQAWKKAVDILHRFEFEIYDQPAQTIEFIRAKTRQAQQKYPNKKIMVLIDYLTLIHTDRHYQSEHLKVGAISKALKAIAKQYDCPVITLAQLSRVVEQRQDKRPMLSDLRESGSIEEDADCIMFLYRDSYYSKEDNDNLEIIVAKHRNGATGTAKVYYNKATGKMADLSDY